MSRPCLKLLGVLLIGACTSSSAHAAPSVPARATVVTRDSSLDVNELRLGVSNDGQFACPGSLYAGLEWPRGSGRSVIYSAGLWVGARVNGETRVTVSEYSSEFAAGPLSDAGQPVDPAESDPAYRVYKIRRGDDASNPDWAEWPWWLGAPTDVDRNPQVIGDQTLWSVYNDAVASKHTAGPGGTAPLGLEVHQTVWGYDRPGPLGRMAFVEFWLFNKGPNILDSAYVGLWCDPDLGGAGDDLVGCDTALDLGFAYNADDDDFAYGAHPPAVGIMLLKGPAVPRGDLPMTGFGRLLKNYLEPNTPQESYARFTGLREDGSPQACAGQPTRFEVSRDPVLGPSPGDTVPPNPADDGCVDTHPADRRLLISTGPFTFAPGSSRRVVIAIIVGGREGLGDRMSNLERLRSYARVAREIYNRSSEIGTATEVDPGDSYVGFVNEPLPFDGRRTVPGGGSPPQYVWNFGDGSTAVGTGLQPTHTYTRPGEFRAMLRAINTAIPVSCGVKVTILEGQPPSPPAERLGLRVFPNPSQDVSVVELLIPSGVETVDIRIYDITGYIVTGRQVTGLSAGTRTLTWFGADRKGRPVPPGVYFARITHPKGSASARFVRVR